MDDQEYSIKKAALWGACCGAIYMLAKDLLGDNPFPPATLARWAGQVVGAAVGGVFMFSLIAAILNFFNRRSR